MQNNQGALHFQATLEYKELKAGVAQIKRDIEGLKGSVQSSTNAMGDSFRNLAAGVGAYLTAASLGQFTMDLIRVRGEFQKTEVAFATMLKSREAAKDLMEQMVDLAAKTPFSLQDVSQGAKQLLAFQVPADEVVDTLTRMGNIAAGLSVPLSRINLVYGQVMAKGRLMGDDLRQFTEAGIPMVAELAKKFNVTTAEITKMVTAGSIGFKDVKDVLFSMTNEGGLFFNLMEEQSKTLSGQLANLQDNWSQMLNEIGQSNEGVLSGGIQAANFLIENYKDVIDILTVLVATYGAYRAALIATVAVQRAQVIMGNVQAFLQLTKAVTSAKDAQLLLNMAVKANPYVLAATALAALGTAIYIYSRRMSEAEEIQSRLDTAEKEHMGTVIDKKAQIEILVKQIQNENTSNQEREKLLKRISSLSNGRLNQLTVEAVRTGKATAEINKYINALEREAKAKALQDVYIENQKEIYKNNQKIINQDFSLNDRYKASANDAAFEILGAKARFGGDDATTLYLNDRNKKIAKQNEDLLQSFAKLGEGLSGAVGEPLDTLGTETEKKVKNVNKNIEQIFSADTIKGLQQRLSALNEKIEITPLGSEVFNQLLKDREALENALAEAEKKVRKKSFEEELSEIKRQTEIRDRAIQFGYDKEYVDQMFPQVKDTTYLQYLEDLVAQLGKLRSEDALEKLVYAQQLLNETSGEKTFLDNVNAQIEKLKENFSGQELIDKLETFARGDTDITTEKDKLEKKKAAKAAQEEEIQQMMSNYKAFMEAHQSFEERKLQITKEYAELRALAETEEEKKKVDEGEKKAISSAALADFQNSDAWIKGFEDMANLSSRELDVVLGEFEKFRDGAGKELSATDFKTFMDALQRMREEATSRNPFKAITSAVKEYIKAAKDGETSTKSFKNVLRTISASADLINQGISSGLEIASSLGAQFSESAQEVIAGVQTTLGGISDLASGLVSMDPAAIIKGIAGVIKGLTQIFNKDRKQEKRIKQWTAEVEKLKETYESLQRSVKNALGEDSLKAQTAMVDNLKKQKAAIQQMMLAEQKKKKADKAKIAEYEKAMGDIDDTIEDIYSDLSSQITQTDVRGLADKLADALTEAWVQGEDAAKAYGSVAEEVMRDAVKNALKMQLLEKPMESIMSQFLQSLGFDDKGGGTFDGLTPAEQDKFRESLKKVSENYMQALEAYKEIFGEQAENAQGLKGDISGVTEKTAGALEGQINAMRVNQLEALNAMRQSLMHLSRIADNTHKLHSIDRNISELNSKTKNSLAGI